MKVLGLLALLLLVVSGAVFLAQPGLLTDLLVAVGLVKRWGCGSLTVPPNALRTLAAAQAEFRANDRDGDQVSQFWRADVRGLYSLSPKGERIKLIEVSIAAADDRPTTDLTGVIAKSPMLGYWFRAIRHLDEDPKSPDPDRFAFCAFPDTPSAGPCLFIVDETHRLYCTETRGGRGIEVYPSQEELSQKWRKLP